MGMAFGYRGPARGPAQQRVTCNDDPVRARRSRPAGHWHAACKVASVPRRDPSTQSHPNLSRDDVLSLLQFRIMIFKFTLCQHSRANKLRVRLARAAIVA